MPKNVVNGFAVGNADSTHKGSHNRARNKIVNSYTQRVAHIKVPRNPINRKMQKQANIITKHWDESMQISVDKKRPIYYKNPDGIDMTYPHGSKVAKLSSLSILTNNRLDNNFNVVVGGNKSKENQMTFVALKVSESKKKLNHN
jgi:hypothetical protein